MLDDAFGEFFGLVFWIALEVENENVLAAKTFTARIDELASAEKDFDARIVGVLVVLSLFPGFFFFLFFVGLFFLIFGDAFLHALVFLALVIVAEWFAVFCDERGNVFAVEVEERFFAALELGDLAGRIVLRFFDGAAAGVVFF